MDEAVFCPDGGPQLRRRSLLIAGGAALVPSLALAKPSGAVYQDFWVAPRSIKLYRKETGEGGEFEYWRDGRLQYEAWFALLHLLRDVRAGVAMHYDPRAVDIVWAVQEWCYRDSGRRMPFRLTDGGRTERTNAGIKGAAMESLHLKGQAIDGRLEGLGLKRYAQGALFFGMGGVGLYPAHVHVDSGSVRKWGGI